MTGKAWGCLFMIAVVAVASLILYGFAYIILGFFDVSDLYRTSLSLLIGISGALGTQWFLAALDKE